ncbi:MAG: hypothetical protein HYX81_04450 [Chloroflexi bacterium]|nr:hypothetical protein [Chloroflexota bacterium]
MGKKIRALFLGMTLLLVSMIFAGCSSGFVPAGREGVAPPAGTVGSSSSLSPSNGLVQSNEGGAVTIAVKWLGQRNGSLVFQVSMDTHSVDLDVYDLDNLALLRDDNGKEYRPVSWQAAAGGHHRSGTLAFSVPGLLEENAGKSIYMVIRDVAGVAERDFRWELRSLRSS